MSIPQGHLNVIPESPSYFGNHSNFCLLATPTLFFSGNRSESRGCSLHSENRESARVF